MVLKPEHFCTMIMLTVEEVHEHIKSATRNHGKWDQGIAASVNHDWGMMLKEGLVYYDQRIYVPLDHALWGEIIAHSHDHITAGHPGVEKTKELVLREHWWPKMKRDIEKYVQGCEVCQHMKSSTQAKQAPLHPNKILSRPWTCISVNMITGLPNCKGYNAIIIIVDRFSKEIILIACTKEFSLERWVKILCNEVYAKHSMFQVVISDRGPQFVSKFLEDLYHLLQIKRNTSMAFHLQTDGQMEWVNQEVEKYLQIFINHQQGNWVEWLALAAFQHNNHVHSAMGKSSFFINHRRHPDIVSNPGKRSPFVNPALENFAVIMQKIHDKTKHSLEKAAAQMKMQYDKKKCTVVEYKPGDKVWLDTSNLHLPWPKKKLNNKQTDPFEVITKKGVSAYTLKLPPAWHIHPTFNEVLFTLYNTPEFPNQQ